MAGIHRKSFYAKKAEESDSDASSENRWSQKKYTSDITVPPSEAAASSTCLSLPSSTSAPQGSVTTSPEEKSDDHHGLVNSFAKPVISTRFTKALQKNKQLTQLCPPPAISNPVSITPTKKCMRWVEHGVNVSVLDGASSSKLKPLVEYSPTASSTSSCASGKENKGVEFADGNCSTIKKVGTRSSSVSTTHQQASVPDIQSDSVVEPGNMEQKQSQQIMKSGCKVNVVSAEPGKGNSKAVVPTSRRAVRSLFTNPLSKPTIAVTSKSNSSTPAASMRTRLGTSSVLLSGKKKAGLPMSAPVEPVKEKERTSKENKGLADSISSNVPGSISTRLRPVSDKKTLNPGLAASAPLAPVNGNDIICNNRKEEDTNNNDTTSVLNITTHLATFSVLPSKKEAGFTVSTPSVEPVKGNDNTSNRMDPMNITQADQTKTLNAIVGITTLEDRDFKEIVRDSPMKLQAAESLLSLRQLSDIVFDGFDANESMSEVSFDVFDDNNCQLSELPFDDSNEGIQSTSCDKESCPAYSGSTSSLEADNESLPADPIDPILTVDRQNVTGTSTQNASHQSRFSERLAKKPVILINDDSSSEAENWGGSNSDVYCPSNDGSSDDEDHPTRGETRRESCSSSIFTATPKAVPHVADIETLDSPEGEAGEVGGAHDADVDCDDEDEPETQTEKISKKKQKQERQRLRNSGKESTTPKGKTIKSRTLRPLPECKAKWCNIKDVTEESRQEIFDSYWNLAEFDFRVQYVAARVVRKAKITSRVRDPESNRNRTCTLEYSLMVNQMRIIVCKRCFLSTLDENDRFVRGIIERQSGSGTVPKDQRGKHEPKHKLSTAVKEEVQAHINSFPRYVSHYSRRHTTQLYLGKDLNLQKMFDLYIESGASKVSLSTYSNIFKEFTPRLKFKTPQLDTCTTCNSFDNLIKFASTREEEETLKQQLEIHIGSADFAYKCKRLDKKFAQRSNNKVSKIVFDLQQVMQCPQLTSGNVYYLRQLSVYNLTVFVTETKRAFNFMWHECLGKRGSDEISSCIVTFFQEFLPPSVVHVIMYSDTCSGQNKNCHMCAALAMVVQQHPTLKMIDQKFLVPGHTHLECDQAHHQIEVKKNNTSVALHHPSKFFDMVREVGPAKKKFTVREMTQKDFRDFEPVLKKSFNGPLVVRKMDAEGNPFPFGDAQWFRFQKEDPSRILFKRTLNEEEPFIALNWKRQKKAANLPVLSPTGKYSSFCPITKEKKKDILTLLPQIDLMYWTFYQDLVTSDNVVDEDPDLPIEFDVAEELRNDDEINHD